jgi:hypothetical protein
MKLVALVIGLLALTADMPAQTPVIPPPMPAEQERQLAAMPPDTQVYERFRYWAGLQPREVQDDWEIYYDRYLQQLGVAQNERARLTRVINAEEQRLEVERWNRILTAATPLFNTNPNAFLVTSSRVALPARRWTSAWVRGEMPSTLRNRDGR